MKKPKKESLDIRVAESVDRFAVRSANLPGVVKRPLGVMLVILGVIMFLIPGPGLLTVVCGMMLISPRTASFVKHVSERYIRWRTRKS